MKRKLISYDAFKKIEEQSLTKAQEELIGAEDVLAKALGINELTLYTFNEDSVTYQAQDGSYVHANYKIDKGQLVLESIQQLVIEESDEKKNSRNVLSNLVDALLEDNNVKANQCFDEYMTMPVVRRELTEAFDISVSKPTGSASKLKGKKQNRSLVAKRIRSRVKTLNGLSKSQKAEIARKRDTADNKLGGSTSKRARAYARKIKPKTMKEWAVMVENVDAYLDYKAYGPIINMTNAKYDNKGNIHALAVPTVQKRNEGKILSFNWKTLDHEVKILRGNVKKLHEDQNFIKAMADLKRYNNISDNNALEETLEAIVARWPDVLYTTESELATQIGTALETANVSNYGDDTCAFMAEAILRTAHGAFTDRVKKIANLAGTDKDVTAECKTCEDSYKEFAEVVEKFYTQLDESDNHDIQVFADLFNALHEIYKISSEIGDEATKNEVENYMINCQSVLNRESQIDLELAEAISDYLRSLTESNVDGAEDTWNVSNTPHNTINGDHPRTSWNAKQTDATPSNYLGDWGDEAPVSDGKSYKGNSEEMRNRSWGNISGADIYPDIKNPNTPKPFGDYKMKEKSAVDDGDNDWSRFQSGDTWPTLKNPYIPGEAGGTGGSGYKMKSDNLIVDK